MKQKNVESNKYPQNVTVRYFYDLEEYNRNFEARS